MPWLSIKVLDIFGNFSANLTKLWLFLVHPYLQYGTVVLGTNSQKREISKSHLITDSLLRPRGKNRLHFL